LKHQTTKYLCVKTAVFALGLILQAPVFGTPVYWTLSGVELTDGSVVTGSFIYDADANLFSDIDIVSEQGTFTVLASTWPAAQENASELVITPNVPLFFGALVPALVLFPSPALTDSGGTVTLDGVNGISSVGVIRDDACDGVTTNKQIDEGNLVGTAIPEPSFAALLGFLGLSAVLFKRSCRKARPALRRPTALRG